MQIFMSQLPFDDEDYYFQISEELESDKEFILIIYDIVEKKKSKICQTFIWLWNKGAKIGV